MLRSLVTRLSRTAIISSTAPREARSRLLDSEKQEYAGSPPFSPIQSTMEKSLTKQKRSLCGQCAHLLLWSLLASLIFWGISVIFHRSNRFQTHLHALKINDSETEVVHWFTVPEQSAAVFFADTDLNNRWTISIPGSEKFPLTPEKLTNICSQSHRMHHHLHMDDEHVGHPDYYASDPDYMQIQEAVASNILPPSPTYQANSIVQGLVESSDSLSDNTDSISGECKRSLTFVMQSADAGLGPTLMSLWLAYGLAKHEKRVFFIDDREWAYGSWSTFFARPPGPPCKPPPDTQRVPCPHQADHLLVSTATISWIFGHNFEDEFEDARKMEVERQAPIFDMMRQGYEALFHLASDDAAYVETRVWDLNTTISPGISVGLHIRHGDKHPYTQDFSKSYIPAEKYVNAANDALFRAFTIGNEEAERNIAASRMILASDDAAVYKYWENGDILRAQDRIILTTPSVASDTSASLATLPLPFDGGFYASKFSDIKGCTTWFSTDPGLEYKALLARAYFMDLAVLGRMDRVVCTVSSIGCRLLAVMLGWDKAIMQKHWINVDGDWDWQGIRW